MVEEGIDSSAGPSSSFEEVLPMAVKDARKSLGAEAAVVLLKVNDRWTLKHAFGFPGGDNRVLTMEQSRMADKLTSLTVPYTIEDVPRCGLFDEKTVGNVGAKSALIVPLESRSICLGIVLFIYQSTYHKFTPTEVDFAKRFAARFSQEMGNAYLLKNERKERLLVQAIMDNSPSSIALVDGKDYRIKWSNKAFRANLEPPYSSLYVRGMRLRDVIPKFEGSEFEAACNMALKTVRPSNIQEMEYKSGSNGTTYWRLAVVPLGNESGVPDLLTVAIDITKQTEALKRVEHLLALEAEERLRLRTILNTLPVGVIVTDSKGAFVEVNRMVDEIWGGKVPIPQDIKDYRKFKGRWSNTGISLKPGDWILARSLTKGEVTTGETIDIDRLDKRKGTVLMSGAPIKNPRGEILGAVSVIQDVTEQKTIETELETARGVLEAVIDQMPAGVAVAEAPSGKLVFGNEELKSIFGRPFIPTSSIEEFERWSACHPDGSPLMSGEHAMSRAIERGEIVRGEEVLIKHPDGTYKMLNVNSAPIRNRMGKITGGVVINVDITKSKDIEKELEQRMKELERSNKELEQFTRIAAHDIREPLRVIGGYLELLRRRYDGLLDEEGRKFITSASANAERLQGMIDNLLSYSKVGTHGKPYLLTNFEHALSASLENLKESIDESGAQISHDPLPTCVADEQQIVQLFQNLVSNSIKYRTPAIPRVHISSELRGDEWIISVKDNGIGIPRDELDKIWTMFHRVHAKREGTGIGLPICRKIVERHGGRIWAESELEKGSTFRFTIPARMEDLPQSRGKQLHFAEEDRASTPQKPV